jgi:hypothetical protein
MALMTFFLLALAWQEWHRNNRPFAVFLAGIPIAGWLATIFGR